MSVWRRGVLLPILLAAGAGAAPVPPPGAPAPRWPPFGGPLPKGAVARLGTLRLRHGEGLERVTLSADGKRVASIGRTDLRLWDATTGQELMPPLAATPNFPHHRCELTADGKQVIVVTTISHPLTAVWYDDTGAERRRLTFPDERGSGDRLVFSPDRQVLAIVSGGKARLWDLATGEQRPALTPPADCRIQELA